MPTPSRNADRMNRRRAFTLVEVLVAMAVLVILVGMIAQMTNGVASVVGLGQAHIDTDGQARALLDRMAIDIGAMVKRPDVDYYLKGRPAALTMSSNGGGGQRPDRLLQRDSRIFSHFDRRDGTKLGIADRLPC